MLNWIIAIVTIYVFNYAFLIYRLNTKHRETYLQLDSPRLSDVSVSRFYKVAGFMFSRRHRELHDNVLSIASDLCISSLVVGFVLIAIYLAIDVFT